MINWTPLKLKTSALKKTVKRKTNFSKKTNFRWGGNICQTKTDKVLLSKI